MARIRSIYPAACTSEKLAACSAEAERCYWRLQTHCDDEGRCEDHPRLIWAALFPLHADIGPADVDEWLDELRRVGLIVRYEVEGKRCLSVNEWGRFQHPQRPKPSALPAPSGNGQGSVRDASATDPRHVSPGEGEGEGEGARADARSFEAQFEKTWVEYPRKVSKKAALKAYIARRRAGVSADDLHTATVNYARSVAGQEPRYVKHGATFYGPDEHWRDFLEAVDESKAPRLACPEHGPGRCFFQFGAGWVHAQEED